MQTTFPCPCGIDHRLKPGQTGYVCAFCRASFVPAGDGQAARFGPRPEPQTETETAATAAEAPDDAKEEAASQDAPAKNTPADQAETGKAAGQKPTAKGSDKP